MFGFGLEVVVALGLGCFVVSCVLVAWFDVVGCWVWVGGVSLLTAKDCGFGVDIIVSGLVFWLLLMILVGFWCSDMLCGVWVIVGGFATWRCLDGDFGGFGFRIWAWCWV